ncbi:hypothetical protein [Crystallibacter crystallopoietes]|uniref:hypothetical protein n=1 Tax=Crystallibacter crystallopoietes TaxID=37928 RepID=UPI000314817D|nr:hypothetical protein [Arthrobacter crystallopoietes]
MRRQDQTQHNAEQQVPEQEPAEAAGQEGTELDEPLGHDDGRSREAVPETD